MPKSRIALKRALGAPLATVLGLSFAYAFSGCSDELLTGASGPRDSSTDTGSCTANSCDAAIGNDADANDADANITDANNTDAGSAENDAGDTGGETDGGDADAGIADGGETDGGETDGGDAGTVADGGSGGAVVRVMAANLTSGNKQSYLDPGIHIFQGLKPDIALIQEFNYGSNTAQEIRTLVDTAFGPSFSYFREPVGSIPNGVVSRYPMIASGEWDDTEAPDRDFAWAKIDIPGDTDLWVISVHLLSSSSTPRVNQANEILAYIGQNVPASDYVILGGDFNTASRGENVVTTLAAKFATSGPYPLDGAGNDKTNMNRNKPYDWVLADPRTNALAVDVRIGAQSFPGGLVFDSRVFTPLSDVVPVVAEDSNAPSMQHMAVVRDFRFP